MFRFDFSAKDVENTSKECRTVDESNIGLEWLPAEEIINNKCCEITIPNDWGLLNVNGIQLSYILSSSNNSYLENDKEIFPADIIPAKYEGGLKIWDCTHHFLNYLTNEYRTKLNDKVVLDLGCGNGLLGILALLLGASTTHFQDYNKDVIKMVTIPSVIKNIEQRSSDEMSCKYYSGDWLSFSELIDVKYDIILTSATIYNSNNYNKLLSVFKKGLKRDGVVLLAAKTYYFGNGGGTRQFEQALKEDNTFCSEVVWTSSEGVLQEILKVTYQDENRNLLNAK